MLFRQTTDNLIRVLENAFMHLGGVPKTLVPDNLKAAVIKADWYDPDLNPKLQSFCEHYGMVLLPTKPRTPRHKGKVERGIAYAQEQEKAAGLFFIDILSRHRSAYPSVGDSFRRFATAHVVASQSPETCVSGYRISSLRD